MDDAGDASRRDCLRLVGVGTAAAVAGCSSVLPGDGGDGDGGSPTDTPTRTPTETPTKTPTETPTETPEPLSDFEVQITQGASAATLDPHDHRSTPTDIVLSQAYEGLLSRDRVGTIQARLATEWERVEPGRARFRLREGPTFQETGNELAPEDVVYTIRRIVDPEVGIESPQDGQLAGVTGAEVVADERAVDVISDGLNPLVFPQFATFCDVVERAWVEENGQEYLKNNVNGTGPFRLVENTSRGTVMERYQDYWREPAAISQLTFSSIENQQVRVDQVINGSSDIAVNVPPGAVPRIREASTAGIRAAPSTRIIFNGMRTDIEPFSSRAFRQAMNYAIDLPGIINEQLSDFGDPTEQPTLEGFFGYNPRLSVYPQDVEQAQQLVEESGHTDVELTLNTPVGRYLNDRQIAGAVADQVSQLEGVDCTVREREFETLVNELVADLSESPPFYLIGWGNATFHAVQTIQPTLSSDGVITNLKDDRVDQMLATATSAESQSKREQTLRDLNEYLHDLAPWIFLNRQYSLYAVSSRIQWEARRDERIDAYEIRPAE